jgi:hypothetical protein
MAVHECAYGLSNFATVRARSVARAISADEGQGRWASWRS